MRAVKITETSRLHTVNFNDKELKKNDGQMETTYHFVQSGYRERNMIPFCTMWPQRERNVIPFCTKWVQREREM
jgi:hypothetical protein